MASLILIRNVVGELRPKRTLAASRGFLAAARLSRKILFLNYICIVVTDYAVMVIDVQSSSESFHQLFTNCSSATDVKLQAQDEGVHNFLTTKLHNCSGL